MSLFIHHQTSSMLKSEILLIPMFTEILEKLTTSVKILWKGSNLKYSLQHYYGRVVI
jgi:hypothetical protein